jgi:hypothetical protein
MGLKKAATHQWAAAINEPRMRFRKLRIHSKGVGMTQIL